MVQSDEEEECSASEGSAEEDAPLPVNDEGSYNPIKPSTGDAQPTRHSLRKRETKPIVEDEMDDKQFEEMLSQPTPAKAAKAPKTK